MAFSEIEIFDWYENDISLINKTKNKKDFVFFRKGWNYDNLMIKIICWDNNNNDKWRIKKGLWIF